MKLLESAEGIVLDMFVTPHSKKFQIKIEDDHFVVFCREPPVKGKVNRELTKELSKLFQTKVQILSSFTSKQKKILISNITTKELNDILSKCALKRIS
jgi:hypothetical protein